MKRRFPKLKIGGRKINKTEKSHSARNSHKNILKVKSFKMPQNPTNSQENNELTFNEKEIVIKRNQELPKTYDYLERLESISIIKDLNSSKKPQEFIDKPHLQANKEMNIIESDMSDSSITSNFLMVNPLDEKTSVYGFNHHVKSHSEQKGEEWTMAIPTMKYPKQS